MSWFVALPAEPGGWFDELTPPPPLKRDHRADLHLTIAFFGAIDEARARAGFEAVTCAEPPVESAPISGLAPLGSVIAALVESPELVAFMARHRAAYCEAAGVAPDERPPLPHVTLARFPRRADRREGVAWAASHPRIGDLLTLGRPSLYGPSAGPTRYRIVEPRG